MKAEGEKRETQQHYIAVCRECGASYDIDFEPPLFCHDDESWEMRIIEVTYDDPGVSDEGVSFAKQEAESQVALWLAEKKHVEKRKGV